MTNLADHSNPYQSPSIPPSSPDESRFRFLPVIVGWAVDFGSSMIVGTVMGVVLALQAIARNPRMTPEDFVKLMSYQPTWFWITGISLGLLCSASGGFVTAWLARSAVWKHVFAMSLLSVGSSILTLLTNMAIGAFPTWWHFAVALTAIPAAYFGGWIRVATQGRATR